MDKIPNPHTYISAMFRMKTDWLATFPLTKWMFNTMKTVFYTKDLSNDIRKNKVIKTQTYLESFERTGIWYPLEHTI